MPRTVHYSETGDVYPGIITRNNAVLKYEKFIHRTFYPRVVHPYSSLRVRWQKAFLAIIMLRLAVISFACCVFPSDSFALQVPVLLFQIGNLCDVCFNFCTGYVEPHTEKAVLDPKKIARRYLLTYFVADFLPCIPVSTGLLVWGGGCLKYRRTYDVCHLISDLSTLSIILRLVCFFRYFHALARLMLWNSFLVGMCCVIVAFCSTILFVKAFYSFVVSSYLSAEDYKVLMEHPEKLMKNYFPSLLDLLLNTIYADTVDTDTNVYFRAITLIVAYYCSIFFVAYFIKWGMLILEAEERFFDLESRVLTFVRQKHLRKTLAQKTLLYFQILIENRYDREDELFSYIPNTFKAEIFHHLCLPLLKNFRAFQDLPLFLLRRLAESLKYQLCLPNEVIVSEESQRLSMYFVQRGTVAFYVKNVELYHFEAGSCFYGRKVIMGDVSSTTTYAISIEVTEIYRLDREKYMNTMNSYPQWLKAVQDKFMLDRHDSSYLLHISA